jgi:hypothetical protein
VARLEAERAARQAAEDARAAKEARAAEEARAEKDVAPVVQTLVTEESQTTSTTISPLFSTEARFATAVRWFQTTVLRSTTFKATAGLVLVLLVGWNVYRPAAPAAPANKQADPSSVGGRANPPVVPPGNTTKPPPAATNPPATGLPTEKVDKPKTEGKPVVVRMAGAIDAERRARQQLESGDAATAFHTVKAGLSVDPKDAPLRVLLGRIVVEGTGIRPKRKRWRVGRPARGCLEGVPIRSGARGRRQGSPWSRTAGGRDSSVLAGHGTFRESRAHTGAEGAAEPG